MAKHENELNQTICSEERLDTFDFIEGEEEFPQPESDPMWDAWESTYEAPW